MSHNKLRPFTVSGTPGSSNPPIPSASLILSDTNRGLLINRMTTNQRDAISAPEPGLLIYNTDTVRHETFNGTTWNAVSSSDSSVVNTIVSIDDPGLDDPTGWDLLFNGDTDDSYVEVPSPFTLIWQGTGFDSVYIGSNSYLTFGQGNGAFTDFLDQIFVPAILISAADNSCQRVYSTTDGVTYLKIRYEGTNDTEGVEGSPTIVWQANFYADRPNVVDILVGSNNRTYDSLTGIFAYGQWMKKGPPLSDTASRFTSTGVVLAENHGARVDFYRAIDWYFGVEELSSFWQFNENIALQTAIDVTPSLNHGVITPNAAFGGISAIPDGNTGLTFHGGEVHIPFNENQWPLKGQAYSIAFAITLTTTADYFRIHSFGVDEVDSVLHGFEILINPWHVTATLYNDVGDPWLSVATPDNSFGAGAFFICLTVDVDGDLTLAVNDKVYRNTHLIANGNRPATPVGGILQKFTGVEAGVIAYGGIDSPTLSNLMLFNYTLAENDRNFLLQASGLSGNPVRYPNAVPALATSAFSDAVSEIATKYWTLDDTQAASTFLSQSSGDPLIYVAGGAVVSGSTSIINDGLHGVRLVDATLSTTTYDSVYFDSTGFSLMIAFGSLDHTEGDMCNVTIKNNGIVRASLRVDGNGTFYGTVMQNNGEIHLLAQGDIVFPLGGRALLFLTYEYGADTMSMIVNGRPFTQYSGPGAIQLGIDQGVRDDNSGSLFLSGNGYFSHLMYVTRALETSEVNRLIGLSGIDNPLKLSSVSRSVDLGNGITLYVENGLIGAVAGPG